MPDREHLLEAVRAWWAKGDSDLRSARILLHVEPPEPEVVCFHSQQAAEKYLKSYLASHGVEPPYTHDLTALLSLCIRHDASMGSVLEMAALLKPFAVHIRYPGAEDPPDRSTAASALGAAEAICDAVRSRLPQMK